MAKVNFLLYSTDRNPLITLANSMAEHADNKGIEYNNPMSYPIALVEEGSRVAKGQNSNEKLNWLKKSNQEQLKAIAQSGSKIHGRSFRFFVREGEATTSLVTEFDFPDAVVVEVSTSASLSSVVHRAPFSYDPAQDYKAEP